MVKAKQNLLIAERNLATEKKRAQAALEAAEANYKDAQAKLERQKQLLDKKLVSGEEYETAMKKVDERLESWSEEEKAEVVRAQIPKIIGEVAEFFMDSKIGDAIGFMVAFIASFCCADLLFIPLALWSSYKVGAGQT